MRSDCFLILTFIATLLVQVLTLPQNEDEALKRVFEYLKRRYSAETTSSTPIFDVHDTHTTPTSPADSEPFSTLETEHVEVKQMTLSANSKDRINNIPLKNEFHKLHSLPGCDFLLNILHEAPSLPVSNDIIDYFDQSNTVYGEAVVTNLKPVLEYSEDYDAVSLLATRKVTRLIFLERMRCSATKFDMFTIKQMHRELAKLIHDEDDSMYDYLATMLYSLPDMSYKGYDPNFLANEMTKHVHGELFNDTIEYLLGTSLLDVEEFSRLFFENLHHNIHALVVLPDKVMGAELKKMVYDSIILANVHCPSAVDVSRRHLDAVWDMTNGLQEIETYQLCMQIRDYLEQFVTIPAHVSASQVKDYDSVMTNICGYVKEYVGTILKQEQEYQKMVAARDPLALQEFFQHYLTEDELTVLAEVLEKLHWTPNFPVTDKPFLPENTSGEFLPKSHVVSNELQDINFWTNYLETLTTDAFEQMDLTDFKESIRRWLKEKQTRLNQYYNMESPSPEDKVQSAQSEDNSESEGPHTQEEPEVNTTT